MATDLGNPAVTPTTTGVRRQPSQANLASQANALVTKQIATGATPSPTQTPFQTQQTQPAAAVTKPTTTPSSGSTATRPTRPSAAQVQTATANPNWINAPTVINGRRAFPAGMAKYDQATHYWYVQFGNLWYPVEYNGNINGWVAMGPGRGSPQLPQGASTPGSYSNPNPPANANLTTGGTVATGTTPQNARNVQHFPAEQGLYDPLTKYWYVRVGNQYYPVEYDGPTNSWYTTGPASTNRPIKPTNGSPQGAFSNPTPPRNANIATALDDPGAAAQAAQTWTQYYTNPPTTTTTTTPTTTNPATTIPTTTQPQTQQPPQQQQPPPPPDPYANLPRPIGLSGPPPSLY